MHPYPDQIWSYHASYSRNARAVGLGWGICSAFFTILAIVAYGQPRWIANYEYQGLNQAGYFGVYKRCMAAVDQVEYQCQGEFTDWDTILNDYFKAATILHGIAIILMLLCVCCLLLFFFVRSSSAYSICGCLQFLAGAAMLAGCLIFPVGWDDDEVRLVCGEDADGFSLGNCEVKWAYALAMLCVFDALFLAILAFVLATRQPEKLDEKGGLIRSADMDSLYTADGAESRHSIAIQPVLTVPHRRGPPSRAGHSEYSYASTRPSRKGDFSL